MQLRVLKNLNDKELRTFYLHITFSIIDGMIRGALLLNEYVFIKSLNGSGYQLSVLFQSSVIVLLLSVFFNELIYRARKKRKMLRRAGFLTHLPLLLLLFFPQNPQVYTVNSYYHYIFLFIFFTYYLSYPIVLPTINLFLKNVYTRENFGRLYGVSTSVRQILLMVTVFLLGLLLDVDEFSFTWFFPVLGVLGFFSIVLFSRIEYIPKTVADTSEGIILAVISSFKKMIHILKNNKAYLDFQIAYLFYGFSFMSTRSVINIFYDKELALNYSSVAFYQNAYNILAIIMLPFFGKLIGNVDPRKFTVIPFISLAGYILFIGLSAFVPFHFEFWNLEIYIMLLIATLFYGFFTATMPISWNIGSSYFGTNEEAGDYQSIHLFATGLRSIFAPFLGVALYEWFGFSWTYTIAIFSLIAGIFILRWSYRIRNK
ncbi:MAG: MFS transporter [Bacteroidales bacterium]|jgi:MFS family permease|nr:MFS transporter [Bacteroidales bacterium]